VIQYDLGHLKGVPLSFTDATVAPLPPHAEEGDSWVFYLAGAESTEDVVQDGPVTGNVLGVMICPAHKPCVAYHVPIRVGIPLRVSNAFRVSQENCFMERLRALFCRNPQLGNLSFIPP
jgi:hypothetical protein